MCGGLLAMNSCPRRLHLVSTQSNRCRRVVIMHDGWRAHRSGAGMDAARMGSVCAVLGFPASEPPIADG